MSIKKLSFMLLSALSLAALLSGCGSSSKEGSTGGSNVAFVSEGTCIHCHSASLDSTSGKGIVVEYVASLHNPANSSHATGCQGCHGGGAQHNGVGPFEWPNPLAAERCIQCHVPASYNNNQDFTALFAVAKNEGFVKKCAACHTADGVGSVHAAKNPESDDCVGCHDVAAPQHGAGLVNDNNGVRSITQEFTKWSHHVTGVTLNNAHCAACHLEGKAVSGAVVIDTVYHMADNKTHLRNSDTDADFAWDPAAPNHTGMDTYCMSCHDANGATSPGSVAIQALINVNGIAAAGKTASPGNPFGDTISNRYDKMQRPAVVDASSQFNTANNSHHAVKGKRYTGRTRAAGTRQIASAATFALNSSAILQGARSTIYDKGNFNQLYTPLEDAAGEVNVEGSLTGRTGSETLGDDSTLHCGDCHTVGQWKVGSSTTALGAPTPAAIGAHGSSNEYLLRNTIGTDERHTQNAYTLTAGIVTFTNPNGAFLVCYNCHSYSKYGSVFNATGLNPSSVNQPHAGEYDQAGRCDGVGNTIPFNGYTTGTATDGTQFASRLALGSGNLARYGSTPAFAPGFPLNGVKPATGEQNSDFGNIFGIQCNNCHNSGAGNAYGGIHGSANNTNTTTATVAAVATAAGVTLTGGAYIDGMGNATKVQRFLPGLGDAMHVPGTLGGFVGGTPVAVGTTYTYITGGVSNDTNWEQKAWNQSATSVFTGGVVTNTAAVGAGCYTLGAGAAASTLVAPSVTGAGGPETELFDTWGGCDDHNAAQGRADHGFIKAIVRPVTY